MFIYQRATSGWTEVPSVPCSQAHPFCKNQRERGIALAGSGMTYRVSPEFTDQSEQDQYPIGSMYAMYGNMDPINVPPMLVYIPYMDPMGICTVVATAIAIL